MVAVLIIAVLFIAYIMLILYYRKSWISIPDFKPQTTNLPKGPAGKPQTFITIIIPARNEESNIKFCLDSITAQSYPTHLFEILVVDDHSTDNTVAIVVAYNLPNIKLISLKDFVTAGAINSYKKKAIEIAIQQSNGELIVTTDADCIVQPNWLQTIAAFYEQKKPSFIVMPVAINCSSRFIEMFQAVDFMTLQGITGASVHKKIHSMCNGANLAYTKKAFDEVNGFAGIDSIASGDDMLLMHKIYKQDPAAVLFLQSKEVIVQTAPVNTIKEFFNQRIRWASKADKYDDKRIFAVLLMVYLFNCLLLVLPVVAIFKNILFNITIYPFGLAFSLLELWASLLIIKTITELFFLWPVAKFFNKQRLLWLFPVMQPFHILYTVIAGWLGKFGSYKWKGRNVK
jgi:cellulose synthase/poly-beta-1,6-N-acetylglucosamine synthase-like glycosyltransferase